MKFNKLLIYTIMIMLLAILITCYNCDDCSGTNPHIVEIVTISLEGGEYIFQVKSSGKFQREQEIN